MGFGLVDRGLRARQLGLVRTRIDLEQQVALLDLAAVLEMDLVEIAGHPGADVDRPPGHGAAGEILEVGDLGRRRQREQHVGRLRGRRRGRCRRAAPARSSACRSRPSRRKPTEPTKILARTRVTMISPCSIVSCFAAELASPRQAGAAPGSPAARRCTARRARALRRSRMPLNITSTMSLRFARRRCWLAPAT